MQHNLPIPQNVLWLILIAVGAIILIVILAKLIGGRRHHEKEYPYAKKDVLFTAAERSFLGVLNQVAGGRCLVLGKVRLADVIRPADNLSRADYFRALNQVAQKHVDFVLCDPATAGVLGVIELDDPSPDNPRTAKRDALVDAALWAAKIPVLHVLAQASYSPPEIARMISQSLKIQL